MINCRTKRPKKSARTFYFQSEGIKSQFTAHDERTKRNQDKSHKSLNRDRPPDHHHQINTNSPAVLPGGQVDFVSCHPEMLQPGILRSCGVPSQCSSPASSCQNSPAAFAPAISGNNACSQVSVYPMAQQQEAPQQQQNNFDNNNANDTQFFFFDLQEENSSTFFGDQLFDVDYESDPDFMADIESEISGIF